MAKSSSRRDFLRGLAGGAARQAPGLAIGGGARLLRDAVTPQPARSAAEPATRPAAMPTALASVEQLLEIAADLGLARFENSIADLARVSLRIAAGTERRTTSFAGGLPPVPSDVDRLRTDDRRAQFIACIDLAERTSPLGNGILPASGSIWLFHSGVATEREPSARSASVVVDENPPPSPPLGAHPLDVAGELTIPRPWSTEVAKLELTESEASAWGQMRTTLAETQGVPAGDTLPRSDALHRILGYPDERRGDMPLACELTARGLELGDQPPRAHSAASTIEAEATHWRMVLQLSPDDQLGWRWGSGLERLYLWADVAQIRPQSKLEVQAIVQ